MRKFFRDCNGIALALFLLMTVQTVQSIVQGQWMWVVLLGLLAAMNGWSMLPPYVRATVTSRLRRGNK